ncbi:hypothetical protein CQ065_06980 [Pseudomonas sp. MYb187]|uniref:hypothetical protein n=1 Tax=Pseudomonas TaxID=286 RepID=UPI000CFAD8A3|nr:hypothetical protein [Pseudomonas sp. MYb187]PRA69319.1 hypothetical protein CQ065_06980 [Pseudomonas sp. MYb187]
MAAQTQLITIDHISEETAPVVYVQNGLKPFLQMIKDEVCGEVPDLTTRKGRERIASLAATVSKRKAAVEKPGRDYLRKIKELPKVIEAELREFVKEADALRDQVRQPLNDWQAAEDARVDGHNNAIAHLKLHAEALEGITAEDLADRIAKVETVALGEQWQEFEAEAARAKDDSLKLLRAALAARQQYEAEQAELARLRAETEAREQKEREERIAREAAERARIEAEQKAQAEREATQRRELEAKAAADRRELELKLQAEQAERARAQAEADRVAVEQRAEQERQAAARRAEEAAEQARLDERRRADAAAAEILRQQQAREADKAHKSKVMGAAKEALMSMNITEELAKAIVLKIARGEVPNITINF